MQSLDVLRAAKGVGVYTKSSIMLGLGETDEEVCLNTGNVRDTTESWATASWASTRPMRRCTLAHSGVHFIGLPTPLLRKWLQCWCAC